MSVCGAQKSMIHLVIFRGGGPFGSGRLEGEEVNEMIARLNDAYQLMFDEARDISATSTAATTSTQAGSLKPSSPTPVKPTLAKETPVPVVIAAQPTKEVQPLVPPIDQSIVQKADILVPTEALQSHRDLNDMV